MKKFIVLFAFILPGAVLFSQPADPDWPSAGERARKLTELMHDKLNLTEEQMHPVAELNLKYALKVDDIVAMDETKREKLKHIKHLNEDKETELKKILTPEQFEKYLKLKDELREKLKEEHYG